MKLEVPIVNAFVDGTTGGNPAGVVLNAQNYSRDEKLKISSAVRLSETAFVSPSSAADFKLEFFTPTMQIAHCGHATIATFSYLRQQGLVPNDQTSKETIDGRREIYMDGEMAYMEQISPKYDELDEIALDRLFKSLGIDRKVLLPKTQPCVVNTGNSFLVTALKNKDTVSSIIPDFDLISEISEEFGLIGYYIFSLETVTFGRDASARMFAPRYGINEESATGMAAGPLACYLHDKMRIEKEKVTIEQGHLMSPPSPSVIIVTLHIEDGSISRLMAGGKAAVSESRIIEI